MADSEYSEFIKQAEASVEYWTETAIVDFTEELSRLMAEKNVSRAELARRIGSSQAYITKVLRGNGNFTLLTMTKLSRALEAVIRIHLAPEGVVVSWEEEEIEHPIIAEIQGGNELTRTVSVSRYSALSDAATIRSEGG